MIFDFFIRGLFAGLCVAAPLGTISIIYISRTLRFGKLSGIVSAAGVTTVETLYAIIAIYGLTLISNYLIEWKIYIQMFWCIILLFVGVKTFFSSPEIQKETKKQKNLFFDYISMLGLALANPITIIGFVTVMSGLKFDHAAYNFYYSIAMIFGFAAGSFSYCMTMIYIALRLRSKLDAAFMSILNQITGSIIILFTIFIFVSSI